MKIIHLKILLAFLLGYTFYIFEVSFIDSFLITLSLLILLVTFVIKYRWKIYDIKTKEYLMKIKKDPINNYSDMYKSLQEFKQVCLRLDEHFNKF